MKERIESLLLKTVANGATESEELSARDMADRLMKKHNISAKSSFKPNNKPKETKIDPKKQLEDYERYVSMDSLHLHIYEIDWDIIARNKLEGQRYMHYLDQTSDFWARYRATLMRVEFGVNMQPLSEAEYRRICYRKFIEASKI